MSVVGNLCMDHLGVLCAGIVEELLDLVAADIAEDAPIFFPLKKPCRPRGSVQAMGPHANDLEHPANGAGAYQLPCIDRRFHLQPLAVVYRVFPAGLGNDRFHLGQLLQRGQGRFIGEIVLPRFHHTDAQCGPLIGHTSGGHKLCFRILQNLRFRGRRPCLGVSRAKRLHLLGIGIVHPFHRSPRIQQAVGHPKNMAVIQPDHREHKLSRLYHWVRPAILWRHKNSSLLLLFRRPFEPCCLLS